MLKDSDDSDKRFAVIEKIILYILPLMAVIGIIFPLIIEKSNLSILGSYMAIPLFFSPIIYMKYRKEICTDFFSDKNIKFFLLLLIFYSLLFSVSIIILYVFDIRPYAYYVTIAIMSTFILFEILLFDVSKKVVIILLQIMFLVLNIIWGVTLKYYYFIERTDPLAHTWYINNLLSKGYVTDIFGIYQQFPMWHILAVAFSYIINLSAPIYKIIFFMSGFNFAMTIFAVYVISLKIFKNKRISLLSSLFTAINPDILLFGMSSLPRSIMVFFEIILILLLLDFDDYKKRFLAILLTFVIIMYHTVSISFIISILFVIYVLQELFKVKIKFFNNGKYLLFAIMATLTYWIYYATSLFEIITRDFINPPSVGTGTITKSVVYTPMSELFNYLQLVPLLFFVLIGILYLLGSNRFSELEKIFSVAGLLLVSVAFPGPVLLLNKFAANFNIGRFSEYSVVLFVMIGAIGLIRIYYSFGRKFKVVSIVLFIVMSFLSISNDFNASDNPLVKRVFYTFYLNEEDIVAFNRIANITNGYVMSDYVTARYLEFSPHKSKSHFLEIDPVNMIFLRNNNSDIMLIRYSELFKRPLRFFPSTTARFELNPSIKGAIDYYYKDSSLWNDLEKYNKIYNSGGVSGFN